jgi:hypothetical protein
MLALLILPLAWLASRSAVIAFRQALGLSNPRASVSVRSPFIALGDELEIHWSIDRDADKLRGFRIQLEGREEVRYQVSSSRYDRVETATRVFAVLGLVDQQRPVKSSGSAVVTVPERSMHSFVAPHNKIVWVLRVHEEIANWPDTDEEFPVIVTPRRR